MAHALTEDHDHREIDDRLLPWPKVKDITGLSRTTAWRLQKAGDFPLPVVISPGRVGWRESELEAWKASRAPRLASALPRIDRSFAPETRPPEAIPTPPAALSIAHKAAQPKRKSSRPDQMTFEF
jgi:predicted DNA-binding transcriptional regulator AlpA